MSIIPIALVFFFLATIEVNSSNEAKARKRAGANDGLDNEDALARNNSMVNETGSLQGNSSSNSQSKEDTKDAASINEKQSPCVDQFADSYCKTRLLRRGKNHCKRDIYFGRMQCCGTCSKAWSEPSGNSSGDSSTNTTSWFMPCTDHVAPDGTSLEGWCREYASPKKNNTIFSCTKSLFVKYRCMKTCGLC